MNSATKNNDLDVSQNVHTSDPNDVNREIDRICLDLYPAASTQALDRAFADVARIYRGEHPEFHGCDTSYHDIQHVLDVTLAMARLIDGYERSRVRGASALGERLFQLGVLTALFHDVGYIRRSNDQRAVNGAEYTLIHVSRGAAFLKQYLPTVGMPEFSDVAAGIIHFTGYEIPVAKIPLKDDLHRLLGNLLGSADIIAQMSDRCYLEKCRDRLYPEFVSGGIARKPGPDGAEQVVFASGEDLVIKTPGFYLGASRRLDNDLDGAYAFAEHHFGGQNLYIDELDKNIRFAREIAREGNTEALRRVPPETLAPDSEKMPGS